MKSPPQATRAPAAIAAFVVNATKSFNHRIGSTGLRTNALRYRASLTGESGPRVAETFLLNTQLRRSDRESELSMLAYYDEPVIRMLSNDGLETVPAIASVALPSSEPLPLRLDQALQRRRSRRLFTGDPIDLRQFAAVVRAASLDTARRTCRRAGSTRRFNSEASRLPVVSTPSISTWRSST